MGGGSSKEQTVGYRYYAGMHIALCHGPIDCLRRIDVDEKEAWGPNAGGSWELVTDGLSWEIVRTDSTYYGPVSSGRLTIDNPDLFGGDSREGGIAGAVDLLPGEPTQGQNDYLASVLGSDLLPSFRGVCSVVLRQVYMGLNPYLKKWMFRCSRIHKAQDGAVQWYDEKAAIPIPGVAPESVTLFSDGSTWDYQILPQQTDPGLTNLTPPTSGWGQGTAPFGDEAEFPTDWPLATVLWLRRTVTLAPGTTLSLTVNAENGAIILIDGDVYASQNPTNNSSGGGTPQTHIIGPYGAGKTFTLSIKGIDEDVPPSVYTWMYVNGVAVSPVCDMNPAHIIRECLTNQDWGLGISTLDIDDVSFTAAADTLYDEEMGISILWNRSTTIETFVEEILRHIDAELQVDNTTGKFRLKLIRDDYDEGTLLQLDQTNIVKVEDFHRPAIGELTNEVTVRYWDSISGVDKTITVQNIAMAQACGDVISTTVNYPGFTNSVLAAKVAARDLRTLSYPRASCTIYTQRIAASLNKGDVFKLSWPDFGLSSVVMRVTSVDVGDGKNNTVRIECTQDTFSLPDIQFVADPGILWESPTIEPEPVTEQIAFELPYLELVQRYGQDFVDDQLTATPDSGYAGIAAVRPSSTMINARLYTDVGAGYIEYGTCDFCPSAALAADISCTDTEISIENGVDLDLVVVGTWGQIDNELVVIDAITGTTATIRRGILDTVPAEHAAGARLYLWDEYAATDAQEYVETDEINMLVLPVTTSGLLDIADATALSVTMASRAARPYPPGNLQIQAANYPTGPLDGELTISWAHRDRTQQTSGTYEDYTYGNIGPETGVTYRLRGYVDGVLDHTEEPITGTSTTWTPSDGGEVTIAVDAIRDGLYSWQAASHSFLYTTSSNVLVTEAGDYRVTEAGDYRVTED